MSGRGNDQKHCQAPKNCSAVWFMLRILNPLLRCFECQPVASSSSVPTDAMGNLSIGTSTPVASVPVQPQPPMQLIAKTTTTQTEAVSLPLVPSSSKLVKRPARPVSGSVGKKLMITANHFIVRLGAKKSQQYDLTITPEVTTKTKCKHIMKCLIEQYKASDHLGNRGIAYDGNKSAFAAGPLPFKNKEFVIVVPEKNGRQREFKVADATKDIDHLRQFLSGRQHDTNPQETIQALDIVLRKVASHERILIVGRSIFSTAFGMGPLGNGVDYCRGFYQSLRPTGMGPSLNVDMSNAQQAETVVEEQALEIGSRCKSIRMPFGSHDLLDLYKSFKIGRQKEIQSLLESGPVSNFAHRSGLPSFLRGRFLRNQRFVQDKKSTSVAASELGLSKQTHTVSDLRKGFLSKAESDDQIHDGDSSNKLELRELSSRRRVSNLLQNGFGLRLDQVLQSYVERQEQATQSDDEWMLEHEQQDLDQLSVLENEDESYQGTVPSDNYDTIDNWFGTDDKTCAVDTNDGDSSNSRELGELMSKRRVMNLLQSGFGLRLDQLLLQSYVKRQEQASKSDDEWMLEHDVDQQQQRVFDDDESYQGTVPPSDNYDNWFGADIRTSAFYTYDDGDISRAYEQKKKSLRSPSKWFWLETTTIVC